MRVKFLKSAVLPKDYPEHKLSEIGVLGRSNAGKSSFINALVGSAVAKVSQQPGKTRLMNFFVLGADEKCLVDMPGYGFAKRSDAEIKQWGKMIETYLKDRENLVALALVMDVRRDWTDDERWIFNFAHQRNLEFVIILTKVDKLNQKQKSARNKYFKEAVPDFTKFPVSSTKKKGFDEVERWLNHHS